LLGRDVREGHEFHLGRIRPIRVEQTPPSAAFDPDFSSGDTDPGDTVEARRFSARKSQNEELGFSRRGEERYRSRI